MSACCCLICISNCNIHWVVNRYLSALHRNESSHLASLLEFVSATGNFALCRQVTSVLMHMAAVASYFPTAVVTKLRGMQSEKKTTHVSDLARMSAWRQLPAVCSVKQCVAWLNWLPKKYLRTLHISVRSARSCQSCVSSCLRPAGEELLHTRLMQHALMQPHVYPTAAAGEDQFTNSLQTNVLCLLYCHFSSLNLSDIVRLDT